MRDSIQGWSRDTAPDRLQFHYPGFTPGFAQGLMRPAFCRAPRIPRTDKPRNFGPSSSGADDPSDSGHKLPTTIDFD